MRKKFLSLFICIIYMMAFIPQQAIMAASTSENKSSADTKVINFLEAFDIMNTDPETGFFWNEMPVKRSEMAKILCKIIGIETIKDETARFVDVSEPDREYIETIVRNRYMTGYDDMKFGSDDYVTNAQLIAIFVTLLGGKSVAENLGGFPDGYVTIGKKMNIIKNYNLQNRVTRIEVANMIYRAMHAGVVELRSVSGNGADYEIISEHTFLTEMLNIYKIRGIINANEATSLTEQNGVGRKLIKINDDEYQDPEQLADDYLGCDVECYVKYDKDKSTAKVVYVEPTSNTKTVTISNDDIDDVSGNIVKYYDENKIRKVEVAVISDMIYNGKSTTYNLERLENLETSDIKFVDNNGDGKYEVIIITEYIGRVAYLIDYDDEKLKFQFDEKTIDLKDCIYHVYKEGNKVELKDIQQGDALLIAISENDDDEKVVRIEASSYQTQGNVQSIRDDDGTIYVKISNVEYTLNSYCNELQQKNKLSEIYVGVSGVFHFDSKGKLLYFEKNSKGLKAAYMIDAKLFLNDFDNYELRIRLFDEDEHFKTLTASEKIKIDDKVIKVDKIILNDDMLNNLNTPQLIQYSAEEDVVTRIIFPISGYDEQAFSMDQKQTVLKCNHANILSDRYRITQDTKIFYIPNITKSDSDYINKMTDKGMMWVLPYSWITQGNTYNLSLYDVGVDGKVKYIVCKYGYTNLISGSGSVMAVNDILTIINEDDEETYALKGLNQNGETVELQLSEQTVLNAKVSEISSNGTKQFNLANNRNVKPGDVIQYHVSHSNKIDDIIIQHSVGEKEYYTPVNMDGNADNDYNRCIYGKVMYVDASSIIVSGNPDTYINPTSLGNKYIENTGVAIYEYSDNRGKYYKIDFQEIEVGDSVFAFVDKEGKTRIITIYE